MRETGSHTQTTPKHLENRKITSLENPKTEPIYPHRPCSHCGRPKRTSSTLNADNHCQQCDILIDDTEIPQHTIQSSDVDRLWSDTDMRSTRPHVFPRRRSLTRDNPHSIYTVGGDQHCQAKNFRESNENKWNRYPSLRPTMRAQINQLRSTRQALRADPKHHSLSKYASAALTKAVLRKRFANSDPRNVDSVTRMDRAHLSDYGGLEYYGPVRQGSEIDDVPLHSDLRNSLTGEPYREHHCSCGENDEIAETFTPLSKRASYNYRDKMLFRKVSEDRTTNFGLCRRCGLMYSSNEPSKRTYYSMCDDLDIIDYELEEPYDVVAAYAQTNRKFSPNFRDECTFESHSPPRYCGCRPECDCCLHQNRFECPTENRSAQHRKRYASIAR